MDWTNNPLCTNLFTVLANAQQLDITFSFLKAGALTMKQLQFYNDLASADANAASAAMTASLMDQYFNADYNMKYTAGNDAASACKGMVAFMVVPTNTVAGLAGVVNQFYIFS